MQWGLLGAENLASQRRTRTLGLGAVVRTFNDLAVPGMGGIWFGKQLFLAVLGLVVAERVRAAGQHIRNIDVANAVEGLACWLALDENGWKADARALGRLKMQGKTDLSFRAVSQRNFYVTQPMRMRTVQPLYELGLVDGTSERFNAFQCTDTARTLIDVACKEYMPKNRTVPSNMLHWIRGDDNCVKTTASREALSPTKPLSSAAREILRERLMANSDRRRALLQWMDSLLKAPRQRIDIEQRPGSLDENHWQDIRSGTLFFRTRDAAIHVLDGVESHIGGLGGRPRLALQGKLPDEIVTRLTTLKRVAESFLKARHDPSPGESATTFCKECIQQHAAVLQRLAMRDDRVLRFRDDAIRPGPAFRGTPEPTVDEHGVDEHDYDVIADQGVQIVDSESSGVTSGIEWPEGMSPRIPNFFLFNADLWGRLDEILGGGTHG